MEEEVKREDHESREAVILEERKEKVIKFFKRSDIWIFVILAIALILGIYIRSLPMADRNAGLPSLTKFIFSPHKIFQGRPGLWDITRNTWTLGPDLDPFLFMRYAKTIVAEGGLSGIDYMRNTPLGFDVSGETQLLPYMISIVYKILHTLNPAVNVELAAIVLPVIMFALTIIAFFLFVREIFIRKDRESEIKAGIIALISTFFMIVIPTFLSRTVAGIPEKESSAFFFIFLSLYLFVKSWKSENKKIVIIFGIFAGISTGLTGLIWGGVVYVFVSIAVATFVGFILNKVHKKELIIYALWMIFAFAMMTLLSQKASLISLVTSLDTGLSVLVFFIITVHFILWNTKLKDLKFLQNPKIPKNILSLIIAMILGVILIAIILGPGFIIYKLKDLNRIFFTPVTGRWGITVAENRQPFFTEWAASFGPFIRNIPVLFWLFFIGSIVLFKKMLNKIKKKDSWVLTGLYIFFFLGLVFSKYSGSSLFNGENFISKAFFYGSALLLIGSFIYYYSKYYKEGTSERFEKIEYEYLVLFSLFALGLFTARSAVRLIMVLAPIAPIFVGFLIVHSADKFRKTKDDTKKIILGAIVIFLIILSLFVFTTFYKTIKIQAYNFVPSSYTQQWQKAMAWTRENLPEDAVFGHWWDYGYWVQTMGERATVLDGGNAIAFWNYHMGRLVLTGDNEQEGLNFLYIHNTTHFLIDSTDIGKYTAFSSIGSNEDFDRYSWIETFNLDEKQVYETKNQTIYVYTGGVSLDEDLIIEEDGSEILLPKHFTGIGAIILPIEKKGDSTIFSQPYIIAFHQGKQHQVNLRYLSVGEEFIDFKTGVEGTAFVYTSLIQSGQGVTKNPTGAAMFISPRLMRGMLANIYILDDPLERYPHYKLVHAEPSLVIDSLNQQGMDLPDFVFFQGVQGPIKIWEIEYTGEEEKIPEEKKEEYLARDYTKYIDWQL